MHSDTEKRRREEQAGDCGAERSQEGLVSQKGLGARVGLISVHRELETLAGVMGLQGEDTKVIASPGKKKSILQVF